MIKYYLKNDFEYAFSNKAAFYYITILIFVTLITLIIDFTDGLYSSYPLLTTLLIGFATVLIFLTFISFILFILLWMLGLLKKDIRHGNLFFIRIPSFRQYIYYRALLTIFSIFLLILSMFIVVVIFSSSITFMNVFNGIKEFFINLSLKLSLDIFITILFIFSMILIIFLVIFWFSLVKGKIPKHIITLSIFTIIFCIMTLTFLYTGIDLLIVDLALIFVSLSYILTYYIHKYFHKNISI